MRVKRALILAAVTAVGSSLGLVSGAQAELRVGKNYRLNSDPQPFRGKDQVALAVNPADPRHIVEVNAEYLTEECEGTASFDGGRSWSRAAPLPVPPPGAGEQPFQPSCRVSNHLAEQMYQTVAFGSDRNVYATSVTARTTVAGGEEGQSALVYKSVDGGRTWRAGVVAMAGGASPDLGPTFQLPTLVVDRGAGVGGSDRLYLVAREGTAARGAGGDVAAAVSNDGGQTFSAPVDADPAGENVAAPGPQEGPSQPVLGPDGAVTVAWRTFGTNAFVKVARSTDQGRTWSQPVTVTGVTAGGHPPTSHTAPLPSSCCSFPRLAVNGQNGNLYIVYNQGPPGPTAPPGGFQGADHFIHDDTDVYFQRSTDSGATWSTPKLINDASRRPGSVITQTRHPNVSVAPNGRVDVVWQDRRHWYMREDYCVHTHLPCDEARLGDTYYAYSTDAGATFSANRRISDRHHNNDVGFDYRFGTGWQFGPVAVPLGNDQLLIGWMDSREGNYDDDNQDIYLARADHTGPARVPQERLSASNDVALSVALSRRAYPGGAEGLMAGTFANRNGTRVVIVNERDHAAALAAGVLARGNLGPVLLSPRSGLPAAVKAEVSRLDPTGAYLVGDESALSERIVRDLADAGVPAGETETVRLGGAGDAATAQLIAQALDRRSPADRDAGTPAFDAAVIANPNSADAGAIAGLAAARRLPVLFVSADSIPAETAEALRSLAIDRTLVIGGPRWVGDDVMDQLPSPKRLGGRDQYATSRSVKAESRRRGVPDNIAYVAGGDRPVRAALAGSAAARLGGLLLLSRQPTERTAAGTARRMRLSARLDRLILVQPLRFARMLRPNVSARQVGRRIRVVVRGRMAGAPRGLCAGRLQVRTRFGRSGRVNRAGRMRGNCRYTRRYSFGISELPAALRPRNRGLVIRVRVRFGGNSRLTGDLSPTGRAAVRR